MNVAYNAFDHLHHEIENGPLGSFFYFVDSNKDGSRSQRVYIYQMGKNYYNITTNRYFAEYEIHSMGGC